MSFSIDLTLENSSIASGSTAISKATPTSGSGPHHHHGAHVHLHHHHDAGEELARRGAGDPRAAAAPRPSGRNMVMARQPGLTVRVIRRKAEDQEADDRARENKARGDDENVDALLAATDRYRL